MNALSIEIYDTPAKAPHYNRDTVVRSATITKAVIVKNGTVSGKPTVDIQFTDDEGIQYVAMITGALVESLAQVLRTAANG